MVGFQALGVGEGVGAFSGFSSSLFSGWLSGFGDSEKVGAFSGKGCAGTSSYEEFAEVGSVSNFGLGWVSATAG